MRMEETVSLSAQWHTISCADHLPGAGLHGSASGGTLASASDRSAAPPAYRSISARRSSGVIGSPRSAPGRTLVAALSGAVDLDLDQVGSGGRVEREHHDLAVAGK